MITQYQWTMMVMVLLTMGAQIALALSVAFHAYQSAQMVREIRLIAEWVEQIADSTNVR